MSTPENQGLFKRAMYVARVLNADTSDHIRIEAKRAALAVLLSMTDKATGTMKDGSQGLRLGAAVIAKRMGLAAKSKRWVLEYLDEAVTAGVLIRYQATKTSAFTWAPGAATWLLTNEDGRVDFRAMGVATDEAIQQEGVRRRKDIPRGKRSKDADELIAPTHTVGAWEDDFDDELIAPTHTVEQQTSNELIASTHTVEQHTAGVDDQLLAPTHTVLIAPTLPKEEIREEIDLGSTVVEDLGTSTELDGHVVSVSQSVDSFEDLATDTEHDELEPVQLIRDTPSADLSNDTERDIQIHVQPPNLSLKGSNLSHQELNLLNALPPATIKKVMYSILWDGLDFGQAYLNAQT